MPALCVDAVDTNGAGDSHCGVLCTALAAGCNVLAAVRRANVAAGLAVSRRGPATSPTTAQIDAQIVAASDGDTTFQGSDALADSTSTRLKI